MPDPVYTVTFCVLGEVFEIDNLTLADVLQYKNKHPSAVVSYVNWKGKQCNVKSGLNERSRRSA